VNVVVLIVAGFIALLNVAVISPLLGQTPVEPASGVSAITVGGVREGGGPPLLESGSPHPVIPMANSNAVIQTWQIFNLRISFSSLPGYNASSAASSSRREIRNARFRRLLSKEHKPSAQLA
jgi:hypothetical protein